MPYRVVPQTVDSYTADLFLILLLDHNDNFSKCNKKIVTDYSFTCVCVQMCLSTT